MQRHDGVSGWDGGTPPMGQPPTDDIPRWLWVAGGLVLAAGSTVLLRYAIDLLVLVGALALTGFAVRAVADWLSRDESVSLWAVCAIVLSLGVVSAVGFWIFDRQHPGGHLLRQWTPDSVTHGVAWAERHGWGQRIFMPRPLTPGPAAGSATRDGAIPSPSAAPPATASTRHAPVAGGRSRVDDSVSRAGIATAVSLTASATSARLGAPVRLTVHVSPGDARAGAPRGTVTFVRDGGVMASARLRPAGTRATASVTVASLPLGSHTIAARYEGSEPHAAGHSAGLRLVVTR